MDTLVGRSDPPRPKNPGVVVTATAFHFTKMQGLGNDFIVVEGPASFSADEISHWSDRRFGIGADGILVLSRGHTIRMDYWNADGSPAEMCGNGLRCAARYVYDRAWTGVGSFVIQTPMGPRRVRVLGSMIEAELGPVEVGESRVLTDRRFRMVDVGNPHAVTFVDDPAEVDVADIGAELQDDFAEGANVEFARVTDSGIEMRVWERGVGETPACGTGMAAAVAAAQADGLGTGPVVVQVPGGRATVEIREGNAWITGPAEYSFTGSVGVR